MHRPRCVSTDQKVPGPRQVDSSQTEMWRKESCIPGEFPSVDGAPQQEDLRGSVLCPRAFSECSHSSLRTFKPSYSPWPVIYQVNDLGSDSLSTHNLCLSPVGYIPKT